MTTSTGSPWYQPRERLLMSRYIAERYPDKRVKLDCSLGPIPEPIILEYGLAKAFKVSRSMRPMVDAVIWDDTRLIIVEAKISRWLDGIAKLMLYSAVVHITPELEEYKSWPLVKRLVIPFVQDNMLAYAAMAAVEVEEYTTPEITDYINNDLAKYTTEAYRRKRAERRATLERLGLVSNDGM